MPLTTDSSSMPLISQDEGYGHGVSIDSMIVTPYVPILGEQLPNVGTSADVNPEEDPRSKVNLLKQVASMVVATTFSIGQDFEDQRLELTSMTTLVEHRQQRIQTLESLLECEKVNYTELQQKLNKANEDLLRLKKEKDMSNQNYSEALDKVKEFRILYQQSKQKVKKVEAELALMKTSVSQVENLLKKKDEEIQMSKSALMKQAAEINALKTKLTELKKID